MNVQSQRGQNPPPSGLNRVNRAFMVFNYSRIPISQTSKGNKNWFEKSKVASNDAKLLRHCFIRGNCAHFLSNRWEMTDLPLAV